MLLRPFEVWPEIFGPLHLLEATVALLTFGIIYEAFSGQERIASRSPVYRWIGGYIAWLSAVTLLRLGLDKGLTTLRAYLFVPIVVVLIGFSLRSVDRLKLATKLLLFCLIFVAGICIHQAQQPQGCVELHESREDEQFGGVALVPDGRPCERRANCEGAAAQPGIDYVCERVGLFGSVTTGLRSRWRGQLGDPNETSIFIICVLPFLGIFGFVRDKETKQETHKTSAKLLSLLVICVGIYGAVLTGSRGGMMVLGLVSLTIFARKFGWKKAIPLAAILVAPLVAVSWRSGEEAEGSQQERSGILADGFELLVRSPFVGIGLSQFNQESSTGQAAHNSYLLTAVECGLPGYWLWIGVLWITGKVPLHLLKNPPPNLDPDLRRISEALLSSIVGMLLGIFFLSFTYKQVFFLWLGLSAALYGAIVRDHPEFKVPFTRKDVVGVTALAIMFLIWVKIAARQR